MNPNKDIFDEIKDLVEKLPQVKTPSNTSYGDAGTTVRLAEMTTSDKQHEREVSDRQNERVGFAIIIVLMAVGLFALIYLGKESGPLNTLVSTICGFFLAKNSTKGH